jgi:hypothetical protein
VGIETRAVLREIHRRRQKRRPVIAAAFAAAGSAAPVESGDLYTFVCSVDHFPDRAFAANDDVLSVSGARRGLAHVSAWLSVLSLQQPLDDLRRNHGAFVHGRTTLRAEAGRQTQKRITVRSTSRGPPQYETGPATTDANPQPHPVCAPTRRTFGNANH